MLEEEVGDGGGTTQLSPEMQQEEANSHEVGDRRWNS